MSRAPCGTSTPANSRIFVGEPGGQRDAAGGNAEEDDARRVGTVKRGLLDDLVSDAGNGPTDVRRGHQFPVGV